MRYTMKLTSIHLQNYRAHRDLRVEFSTNFNVVAGINGSGKTSLLKGISEGLAGLLMGVPNLIPHVFKEVDYAYVSAVHTEGRYRFEPLFPVTVKAEGRVVENDFTITVKKASDVAQLAFEGRSPLRDLIQGRGNSQPTQGHIVLPVVAFYRANRQWIADRSQV